MAVVSLLNQAPYRRTHSSREKINEEEECDFGRHYGHKENSFTKRKRGLHPGCRSESGQLLDVRHQCSLQTCDRITINVSGQYFETWRATIENHPDTLLGDPTKRQAFYDHRRKEYFFDRHRPSFDAIFDYYRYGGHLKRPPTVSDDIFLTELEFFELEKEIINDYRREEGYIAEKIELPEKGIQRKLWMTLEFPETSLQAYVLAVVSCLFTVVSIALFCVETLPRFEHSGCTADNNPMFADPFFILETICTIFFTLEVFARLTVCPHKKKFLKDLKNLVDITAIVPYYITLFNLLTNTDCSSAKSSASLAFLRVIRLVRIFKLTKHSAGLQVLILTFKASFGGLCLFLVALVVCILVFSSAVYFAEVGAPGSQINSIPEAFWWAIITMTTVGYGDVVPVGTLGKIIGMTCALAGVLTLAIPVPIITENFNKFYAHKTGRGRH